MNRILHIDVRAHSTVPAEAEVRITVVPESLTPTTEVRGRLMGPRCRFASTVEVAYHLRPLPAPVTGALMMRAIIPEASLWEPEGPFLYEGPVELWQDGRRCDRVLVRHGLRTVTLGSRGLRVNGKALVLRGQALSSCSEAEALELRRTGHNLVVAEPDEAIWEVADRVGLFVLGRLTGPPDEGGKVEALAAHPSALGWLVGAEGSLVGTEGAAFVIGPPEVAETATLPVLVFGEAPAGAPSAKVLGNVTGPFR
jgi:hypothetical protein